DAIVAYIANQWAVNELEDVPGLLHSIEGSLNMIPLPRVARILAHAAAFVQEQLINDGVKPQWSVLETFADVLTGVEYFLERYSDNPRSAGDDLLQRAEVSLRELPFTGMLPGAGEISLDGDEQLGTAEAGEFSPAGQDDEEIIYALTEELPDDTGVVASDREEELTAAVELADVAADMTADMDAVEVTSAAEPDVTDIVPADEEPLTLSPAPVTAAPVAGDDQDDDLIDDEIIEIFLEEAEEVTA